MPIDPIMSRIQTPTVDFGSQRKVGFGDDFAASMDAALNSVSDRLNVADVRLARVASGEEADIHGTMIALQEADISLRMMVSVRDKAVDAYEKIMNMQV
jgi:flagellar hook-basal body complex protein FliE